MMKVEARMKRDGRMVYVHLVDDKSLAREYGSKCLQYGNFKRAWQWFRRYDDLVLLEIARSRPA